MARIRYADSADPDLRPLVDRIVAERGSVLHLYRMLLHSPPIAAGWLQFLTAVRQQCRLSGYTRELVIMRVAALNGATYEAEQHAAIALAEGLTAGQLGEIPTWEPSKLFGPRDRAVLAYTDAMTRDVQVPDEVFAAVRAALDERDLVELTVTIAAYNMVSRVLEALRIHSHDGSVDP